MLPKLFASTVACAGPEVQLIGPAPRKSARPVTRRQGMIRMSAVTRPGASQCVHLNSGIGSRATGDSDRSRNPASSRSGS